MRYVQCTGTVVAVAIYDVVQDGIQDLAAKTKSIRFIRKDKEQGRCGSLETKPEDCSTDKGSNEGDICVACPSGDELIPTVM